MLAAAEHEVLEKMSEAGFARLFIFRADVVPDINGDDGGLVVFVNNDAQAVVEGEFLTGNFEL